MKVTPSNQTLILANERLPIASRSGSVGPPLQRVTLIAAHPDSTVLYLEAEYGATVDTDPIAALPSVNAIPSLPGTAGAHAINLYARTQRLPGANPRSRYIDVLA